jgi:hypothetical protein
MGANSRLWTLFNVAGFNAVWFSSVLGAAHGMPWLGPAMFAPFCLITLLRGGKAGADLSAMAVCSITGLLLDSSYLWTGLVSYASPWPSVHVLPVWLLVMWLNFALTMNHSLGWLGSRPWLAAAFGSFGGATSYFAGARLGALNFEASPALAISVIAVAWGIALPLLYRAAGRQKPPVRTEPAQIPR